MEELVEALTSIRGEYVDIYTQHKLFGDQHLKMNFIPYIENGFGFCCKSQNIYIPNEELAVWVCGKNQITIKSKDMKIEIIKGD